VPTFFLSDCISLEKLNCNHNQLTSLTIAGLSVLEEVVCHHNLMPEVNVSGCFSLKEIHCLSAQRTALSITGLTQGNSPLSLT